MCLFRIYHFKRSIYSNLFSFNTKKTKNKNESADRELYGLCLCCGKDSAAATDLIKEVEKCQDCLFAPFIEIQLKFETWRKGMHMSLFTPIYSVNYQTN